MYSHTLVSSRLSNAIIYPPHLPVAHLNDYEALLSGTDQRRHLLISLLPFFYGPKLPQLPPTQAHHQHMCVCLCVCMYACALHLLDLCFLSTAHPHNLQFRLYLLSTTTASHLQPTACTCLPAFLLHIHNLTIGFPKPYTDCRLSLRRFVVLPSVKSFCFLLPFIAFRHCAHRRLSIVGCCTSPAGLYYRLPLELQWFCHIFVLFCSDVLPFHFISLRNRFLFISIRFHWENIFFFIVWDFCVISFVLFCCCYFAILFHIFIFFIPSYFTSNTLPSYVATFQLHGFWVVYFLKNRKYVQICNVESSVAESKENITPGNFQFFFSPVLSFVSVSLSKYFAIDERYCVSKGISKGMHESNLNRVIKTTLGESLKNPTFCETEFGSVSISMVDGLWNYVYVISSAFCSTTDKCNPVYKCEF